LVVLIRILVRLRYCTLISSSATAKRALHKTKTPIASPRFHNSHVNLAPKLCRHTTCRAKRFLAAGVATHTLTQIIVQASKSFTIFTVQHSASIISKLLGQYFYSTVEICSLLINNTSQYFVRLRVITGKL
jgi:hypothetical protein